MTGSCPQLTLLQKFSLANRTLALQFAILDISGVDPLDVSVLIEDKVHGLANFRECIDYLDSLICLGSQ